MINIMAILFITSFVFAALGHLITGTFFFLIALMAWISTD